MRAAPALAALAVLAGLAACFAFAVPVPLERPERAEGAAAARAEAEPAPAGTVGAGAFAGPWELVSFEMRSWGDLVSMWQVRPDGSGFWREGVREPGARPGESRIERHDLAADPALYARLQTLVEALPFPPPASDGCGNLITDQPYGSLVLTKGAAKLEFAFNAGCLDEEYRSFLEGLSRADLLVSEAGRASPVVEGDDPAVSPADAPGPQPAPPA